MSVLQTLQNSRGESLVSDGHFLAIGIREGEGSVNIYAIKIDGFEEINGISYIKEDAIICSKPYLSPQQDLNQVKTFAMKIMEKEKELLVLKEEANQLGVFVQ